MIVYLYTLSLLSLAGGLRHARTLLAQRKEAAAAEIRLMGLRDESRNAFWDQLDVAYFLRHEASDIAWHTRHLYFRVNSPAAVVKARIIGQNDGLRIMVYTPDRDDLFASICRYFYQRSLSVQEARIHTTRHGWALDSFVVLLPAHEDDLRSHATLIEHELTQKLDQNEKITIGRPAGATRQGSRRSRVFPIVPNVELQPDEQGVSWRLSVTATDRPGLLYSLAHVFAAYSINLKMAKVMTLGDRVEDIFIIESEALAHPRIQLQFERSLLSALDETISC
jgi:[protein-PII] uridylyltransferase